MTTEGGQKKKKERMSGKKTKLQFFENLGQDGPSSG